ncbi:hypothetical protein HPP92_011984 [Vanilla planifolia]|uniref:SPARK domain-containing protein n=1 Tax=Vanilla planifolia TaxID=51239 RepID=A0A835R9I8_VANPL|nr:hypothetical protein HPP92_011984 [Vanilla planifolia]
MRKLVRFLLLFLINTEDGGRMRVIIVTCILMAAAVAAPSHKISAQNEPFYNAGITSSSVPAFPVTGGDHNHSTSASCRLDLSEELFGGVEEACGRGNTLDRNRCCPVLAAWLFAAHSRSALHFRSSPPPLSASEDPTPLMPETDSKRCSDALQAALTSRNISLPRPNATCDAALCFCGIHLHDMASLSCPNAFNLSADSSTVKPSAAVRALEVNCRNASYAGCTRCLSSLNKLKGDGGGGGMRMERMMDRDCRLMGLTWLLGRNKTVYIPTVSAVLRAILYGESMASAPPYRCSPDQDNMPLAVDTVQFQQAAERVACGTYHFAPVVVVYVVLAVLVAL